MASAGKVSPITRGTWDSTASYTRLDIVTNPQNTKSYICKKDNTNTPLENTEFWQVLVNIGDASGIEYDNTTSGMTATNVKEALDELASKEIELDDAMSDTSENAVKNKAIKEYVDNHSGGASEEDILNIKKLGWTVPSQLAVKNYIGTDGKFHKKIARKAAWEYPWSYNTTEQRFQIHVNNIPEIKSTNRETPILLFGYEGIFDGSSASGRDKVIYTTNTNAGRVIVKDTSYTDVDSFIAHLASTNAYIYYELATEEVLELDGYEAGYFAKRNVTTNQLKPTLQSTTVNGIVFTNNGDGTYTLSGTASGNISSSTLFVNEIFLKKGIYKFVCTPIGGSSATFRTILYDVTNSKSIVTDIGESNVVHIESDIVVKIYPVILSGTNCNNLTFKPMLTTNLDATYDDFVPYTGDTGSLNGDVASLQDNLNSNNAGAHNGIYRGKFLGDSVTDAQYSAIANGTFEDLYVGDYWTIGGVNWRIAHFDYWLHTGNTECTKHHVVIVPDTSLYSARMNATNVTTGAYVGSEMYTQNLEKAKTTITTNFGAAHVLTHRELLANTTVENRATNWSWYDSTVELMNESMVYGSPVGSKPVDNSINFNVGIDKSQLALFALDHSRITNRALWWLRCVVSSTYFALVYSNGDADYYGASSSVGVRPAFGLVGN